MGPTRTLAQFVADAPVGVASPRATEIFKHAVLDLLGCIVAGADEEAGRIAADYAVSQSGPGKAAVLGAGRARLSPGLASLANGTAGHALDFDDIGVGVGHVSVAMIPGVLAVAEDVGADGTAFLDALLLGYEVASRLTVMYPDSRLGPYAFGFHKPGVYAALGGAVACGRLLGLSGEGLANALGIAATQAGGLRANFGTMTKPLHAGIANRTAVEAALLAVAGFTASTEIIEQRFGWHDTICRGEGDLALVTEGLGSSFRVEEGLVFKAYPCCGANHYAIGAVLDLVREHSLSADDVDAVEVQIEARNLEEVLVYDWPRSPLEGKFCLAYNVAAALVDRAVTAETFTDAALARLGAARDLVWVYAVADLPQNGARVTIRTNDGRVLSREQLVLRGSLADPMSTDELATKFRGNLAAHVTSGRIDPDGVDDVLGRIATLEKQPDLTALTEPLR